jgi:uncharacterized protein YndB with AHSA1/START domain
MLKKIVLVLVALLAMFLVVVYTRPADFRYERSIVIDAPPTAIFENVDDLARWTRWSPWEKLDPAMQRTYSATTRGSGATYTWQGNSDVGKGTMTIVESLPNERIAMLLEFKEPMAATNQVQFTFTPNGESTTVVWAMSGRNNFLARAFDLVLDLESMVTKDFDKGLAQLKAVVETGG